MRAVLKENWDRPKLFLAVLAVLTLTSASLLFAYIDAVAYYTWYTTHWKPDTIWAYFENFTYNFYILTSWTGLYFGINYYLMFQAQTEQTLKASAIAHQAQLKMLRYQLNPHFLFNTLNAISTLVLEKQVTDANNMLTRLSSFLRYSLVNEPTHKVTLDQELHAMNLYLDIEKVRFQDRLKLEFSVEDRARQALIPSLLLQPLIENAIKYAIAPSETGGTVAFGAKIENGQLCLTLTDDGPGIVEHTNHDASTSSGVGLSNTRERLQQIYGGDHSISIDNVEPRGLKITICIPSEFTTLKGDGEGETA